MLIIKHNQTERKITQNNPEIKPGINIVLMSTSHRKSWRGGSIRFAPVRHTEPPVKPVQMIPALCPAMSDMAAALMIQMRMKLH